VGFVVAQMGGWGQTGNMKYWLMKSEPETFSLQALRERPGQVTPWDGVRNYQARNFMRDEMQPGDRVLFYHSNCNPPGVAGLAEVASEPYDDKTALDPKSDYYDEKSTKEKNRWQLVDIRFVEEFPRLISLQELKENPKLAEMRILQKGNRLSITPVTKGEFNEICRMGQKQ